MKQELFRFLIHNHVIWQFMTAIPRKYYVAYNKETIQSCGHCVHTTVFMYIFYVCFCPLFYDPLKLAVSALKHVGGLV